MSKLKFSKKVKDKVDIKGYWKILIVDDDPDIHKLTKTVLANFTLDGKGLEFISAYNGEEAIELLEDNPDISVILLDVVMETDDAGLRVVEKIRNELKNNNVRIILRTGQPGSAPEEEVIRKYRINDYKEKTELTAKKMFSVIITAIRSYQDLTVIKKNKEGLEKIIEAMKSILEETSLKIFAEGVLTQLISILNLDNDSFILNKNNALSIEKKEDDYSILASTGKFQECREFEKIDENVKKVIFQAIKDEKTAFYDDYYVKYFKFNKKTSYLIYISGVKGINDLDKNLTEIFSNNIAVAFNNISLNKEILSTQKEIIEKLGDVVEKRSQEASNHVYRVAELSYLLAKDIGMEEWGAQLLRMASPMHDIGKIGIPDNILLKPGKLTKEEFEIMKTHASIGYDILKDSKRDILEAAAIVAHEHHEKFDGTGYPNQKKGKNIHIFGRITAVVDVLDALSHKRCYKDAWDLDDILDYLKEQSNKQFDKELVDVLLENIDKYKEVLKM